MTDASLADFSHLLNDSWEIRLEAGGVDVNPDCLEIRLKQLLSFEDSVLQPETAAGSTLWSVARPVPSGLRLRCPQKLIHQQATGLRTSGGVTLNQS